MRAHLSRTRRTGRRSARWPRSRRTPEVRPRRSPAACPSRPHRASLETTSATHEADPVPPPLPAHRSRGPDPHPRSHRQAIQGRRAGARGAPVRARVHDQAQAGVRREAPRAPQVCVCARGGRGEGPARARGEGRGLVGVGGGVGGGSCERRARGRTGPVRRERSPGELQATRAPCREGEPSACRR